MEVKVDFPQRDMGKKEKNIELKHYSQISGITMFTSKSVWYL